MSHPSFPRPRHDVYDDTPYARRDARRTAPHRGRSTVAAPARARAPAAPRPRSHRSRARAGMADGATDDGAFHAPAHYPQPAETGERLTPRAARRAHDDVAADMRAELERASADFGPLFATGAGLFGGLISSFDRVFDDLSSGMFDERTAQRHHHHHHHHRGGNGGGGGSGSFFYESRRTTVGPDGRVREETVRTAPGPDGRPRTTRNVREGVRGHSHIRDGDASWAPGRSRPHDVDGVPAPPQRHGEPDVVVEELDEHGNVISSNAAPGYPQPRLEAPHGASPSVAPRASARDAAPAPAPAPGAWLHDRYRQWRGNRV